MKFHTTLLQNGKTATGIVVPDEVVEQLGAGKRPAVRVTINGHTYRNTVAVMGGEFMLSVSAAVREQAGVAAGDELEVELELDTQPRELAVPEDFKKVLQADAQAKGFFDGLSYSKKQRFVIPIETAKTAETRQRRIDKALEALREGRLL